ncbi:secreted protein C-like isoform X1 [Anopheles albimanus]|uniref:secreted protein C-like isoform X1 n=1 Tax=Anopheles albimanus TaxID=7167 RepID=UPI001640F02B|nr:secreted protein C-like isoform X1 [Anopheles albimanus]
MCIAIDTFRTLSPCHAMQREDSLGQRLPEEVWIYDFIERSCVGWKGFSIFDAPAQHINGSVTRRRLRMKRGSTSSSTMMALVRWKLVLIVLLVASNQAFVIPGKVTLRFGGHNHRNETRNIPSPGIPGFFNPLNSFGGSSTSSNANAIASSFGSSNGLSASNAASNAASHSFGGLGQSGFYPGFASSSAGSSANAITNSLDGFSGFSGSNAASNALSQNVGGFGISSSNANANAFSQGFNPDGFGSSAANAQAQSFQSDSPFGSFGASAANAASQGISFGSGGLSGSASQSGSQSYNLPGNRKISLSYSNGFSLANGAPSVSNGFSISQS